MDFKGATPEKLCSTPRMNGQHKLELMGYFNIYKKKIKRKARKGTREVRLQYLKF